MDLSVESRRNFSVIVMSLYEPFSSATCSVPMIGTGVSGGTKPFVVTY
ncbi:hypothetical protein [Natrialba sp. PRR66]|nr:hypothetical protein [Natrialba sp. PRR66]